MVDQRTVGESGVFKGGSRRASDIREGPPRRKRGEGVTAVGGEVDRGAERNRALRDGMLSRQLSHPDACEEETNRYSRGGSQAALAHSLRFPSKEHEGRAFWTHPQPHALRE